MAEQNLKLNVTADVSAAQSALKKLNSTLEKAKGVITDISGGGTIKSIDDPLAPITEGAKGAVTALEKVREALKQLKAPNLRNLVDNSLGISRVNGSHFETEFEQRRKLLEDGTYAHAETVERRHRIADSQSANYRSAAESAMVFERNGFASAQTQYLDWIEGISQASKNIDVDALLGVGRAAKSAAESAKVFESADAETSARNLRSLMHERELYADYNARIKETAKATKAAAGEISAWDKVSAAAASSGFGLGSSLSHLLNQFKRIATYRVFKSILKGITDSFRIGTQNLVQYSAAMNGLDAAAANPTMSTYATQLLYVRNSVAAAAMPALQALVPVISTVANWFVTAANAVNQFISAIQGKSTFTKAKEYAVDYAGAVDGIGSAAGRAAKQMQQLMDFDEINNIISPKDSGGGGGGGATPAQDFTEMFEEAIIGEKFQKIADFVKGLKDNFDEIWNVVKLIGAALLAWKVASAVINTINDIRALAGAQRVGAGLILTIAGITLAYEGGKMMADSETQLLGIITSALGTLAAGVGGYLLAGAVGLTGGVGFAIGIGVGLVATLTGFLVGTVEQKWQSSPLAKVIDEIHESCDKVIEDTISALDALHDKISDLDQITGKADLARELVNRLMKITSEGKLTEKQIAEVKAITEQINKLKIDGLQLEYNELTGEISMTKDEIYKTIAAFEKQAKATAYMAIVEEAEKSLAEATRQNRIATEEVTKAKDAAMKADQEFTNFKNKYGILALVAEGGRYWDLKKAVDETHDAYDHAVEAQKTSKAAMEESKSTITYYTGELSDLATEAKDASGKIYGISGAMQDLSRNAVVEAKIKVSTEGLATAGERLAALRDSLKNLGLTKGIDVNTLVRIAKSQGFANGGFPTQGSIFLAGETAGQTEWLGNVNGKTGVVSGNEITGIADAIYAASERETQTLGNLLMQIAKKELTITPSASLGRVNAQSAQMYGRVTGA